MQIMRENEKSMHLAQLDAYIITWAMKLKMKWFRSQKKVEKIFKIYSKGLTLQKHQG